MATKVQLVKATKVQLVKEWDKANKMFWYSIWEGNYNEWGNRTFITGSYDKNVAIEKFKKHGEVIPEPEIIAEKEV